MQTFSAVGASLMPDALAWGQGSVDSEVPASEWMLCSPVLRGRSHRCRIRIRIRLRIRLNPRAWQHGSALGWDGVAASTCDGPQSRSFFPRGQGFPPSMISPNHRSTHLGNPDPRTMTGLSHAAQTIMASCAHGGCQSCLVSATIKENCATPPCFASDSAAPTC
jgi:hypothetical protein